MRSPLHIAAALIALGLLGGCGSISKVFDGFRNGPDPASASAAAPPLVIPPRPPAVAPAVPADRPATGGVATAGSPATAMAIPGGESRVASVTLPAVTPVPPRDDAFALPPDTPRAVYFDFDSSEIRGDSRSVIETHARALAADRTRRLILEGHTDERGGREYNLALGQKRAEAVQRALMVLGANDVQLEAVSFGKERPAAQGTGEEAWARNRRVELKDRR